jgi:SOS response regulatory protein OraA/RecX
VFPFKKKEEKPLKQELITDLTDYLVDKGFSSDIAQKLAKDFWDKNYEKLKKLI